MGKKTNKTVRPAVSDPQTPDQDLSVLSPPRRKSSVEFIQFGFTGKGDRFSVPETRSVFKNMTSFNVSSALIWTVLFACILVSFLGNLSIGAQTALFVFWRLCYNVGLGFLLRTQSNSRWLSKGFIRVTSNPDSAASKVFSMLIRAHMSHVKDFDMTKYPKSYTSWLLFRQLVDLILCCDVCSYLILVYKCIRVPEEIGLAEVMQYLAAVLLGLLNFWAKVDAHRCIGDYAWYWGDFFFTIEQHLTFDGVFQLFPHPMYTVGYALYYGFSLASRSYTVLLVSLFAHSLQILFLVLVENPHIDKIYGKPPPPKLDPAVSQLLYQVNDSTQITPSPIYFVGLDIFQSADVSLIVASLYAFLVSLSFSRYYSITHVVVLRILHWFVTGTVLSLQSRYQWITKKYQSRGKSIYEAFLNWKSLYNFSATINVVVFIASALNLSHTPSDFRLMKAKDYAYVSIGLALIAINFLASMSIHRSISDFGWFYGDFFVPPESFKVQICYTGVYRFMNNPDCVIGYVGYHGIALISQSWSVFFLALASQLLNIIFVVLVEVPHMNRLYDESLRREEPIPQALKDKLLIKLASEAQKIREKASFEIFEIYTRISQKRKESLPSKSLVEIIAPSSVFLGSDLEFTVKSRADHSVKDWIGLYDISTSSTPGNSKGAWVYVPPGSQNKLVLPSNKLPTYTGVFELRYHLNEGYSVIASSFPIMFVNATSASSAQKPHSE